MKKTNDENYKYASSRLPYKGVVENKIGIDLIDLAILDFMRSFASSGKCITMEFCGIPYFKITCNHISKNLPLLGISTKQGIIRRLNKLVEKRILEYENNAGTGSYYSFTNLCESLGWEYALFSDKTDNENGHHRQPELSLPTTTVVTTDNRSCHPSISNNNISTINNCNKNKETKEKYKKEKSGSSAQRVAYPADFLDAVKAYGERVGKKDICLKSWLDLTDSDKARCRKVIPYYVSDQQRNHNGDYKVWFNTFLERKIWESGNYPEIYTPRVSYSNGYFTVFDEFTDETRPHGTRVRNIVWDAQSRIWRE